MFKRKTEYVPVPVAVEKPSYVNLDVTVHEHRAPTDESVRLLNEMRDETSKNIIAQIPLKNNVFEGHVMVETDNMNHQNIYRGIAVVNGQRIVVEHRAPPIKDRSQWGEPLRELCEKMAEAIARDILMTPFIEATRTKIIG